MHLYFSSILYRERILIICIYITTDILLRSAEYHCIQISKAWYETAKLFDTGLLYVKLCRQYSRNLRSHILSYLMLLHPKC